MQRDLTAESSSLTQQLSVQQKKRQGTNKLTPAACRLCLSLHPGTALLTACALHVYIQASVNALIVSPTFAHRGLARGGSGGATPSHAEKVVGVQGKAGAKWRNQSEQLRIAMAASRGGPQVTNHPHTNLSPKQLLC